MPLPRTVLRAVQAALAARGFDPGPVDGLMGPRTTAAVRAFQLAGCMTVEQGGTLRYPGTIGPSTLEALGIEEPPPRVDPPWVVEARRVMGLHERTHNRRLRDFLRSDGPTLGDPAKLPWCGDFVETCIRLALPSEEIPENPYWARHWLLFGRTCEPVPGAVVVFSRGSGGHVGFVEGRSGDGRYVYTLGGNQANRVSVVKMSTSRVLGYRWPEGYPMSGEDLSEMVGGTLSTNEA